MFNTTFVGVDVLGDPQQTNFGRELVFSADLCYNETNEKPRPLGEVAAKPTERANGGKNTPSHPLSRELSQGESLWVRATLEGYGLCPKPL